MTTEMNASNAYPTAIHDIRSRTRLYAVIAFVELKSQPIAYFLDDGLNDFVPLSFGRDQG